MRFSRLRVSVSLARRPCTALFSLTRNSLRHSGGRSSTSDCSSTAVLSAGGSGHLATIYSLVVPVVLHLLKVYQQDSRGLARVSNTQQVAIFEFLKCINGFHAFITLWIQHRATLESVKQW